MARNSSDFKSVSELSPYLEQFFRLSHEQFGKFSHLIIDTNETSHDKVLNSWGWKNLPYVTGVEGYGITLKEYKGCQFLHGKFCEEWYNYEVISAPKGKLWKVLYHFRKSVKNEIPIMSIKTKEVVDGLFDFLKKRHRLKELDVCMNRGVLFFGEPGNGKTLISSYLMKEGQRKGYEVHSLSKNFLVSRGVPYNTDIAIFDDFDITPLISEQRNDVTDALLSEMDGPAKNNGRIYIITTNELKETDKIQSAIVRPGRIDTVIKIEKPTIEMIAEFINKWKIPLQETEKEKIAKSMLGCSFAQIGYLQQGIASFFIDSKPYDLDKLIKVAKNSTFIGKTAKKVGFDLYAIDDALGDIE